MRAPAGLTLTLILLVVMFSVTATAADRYQSNAVGIQGERIDPRDPGAGEEAESPNYVLEISFVDGTEVRTLYRDDTEVQRTEVSRDGTTVTEELYRDGSLESQSVRRDDGVQLHERLYSNGVLTERWEFGYNDRRLTSREAFGPSDELLYAEFYSYWRDGTLRSIVKEDQSAVRTEYRYRDGRLEEEWVSRPGEAERFEFDAAGRLVIRELYAGDELAEQEVRLYWAADSGSLLKQVVVSAGEEIVRRGYDESGRLTSERVEEAGRFVRELTRVFSDSLLVREIETDRTGERMWEYSYTGDSDDDPERERETYSENGQLVEISYLILESDQAPANRMTELYNRGEPVLRVYYRGQLRLREDVIRDGEVIRTRDFVREAGGDTNL